MKTHASQCFDVIFGLGAACSCSQTLRVAGLQLMSFPFDWLLGSDIVSRTRMLLRGFDGAFKAEDFEEIPNPGAFRHASYRNRTTGLLHFHDFDQGRSLEEQVQEVCQKYTRRCERLSGLISKARRVLVVWLGDPRDTAIVPDDDVTTSLELLRERFPNVAFSCLVFDCTADRNPDHAKIAVVGDITRIAFDYRRPGAENAWEVCSEWLLPHLAKYSVVDYRTRAQKKAFERSSRARDRARFPAATYVGYLLTKLEFKVWRHLKRKLERRGVAL